MLKNAADKYQPLSPPIPFPDRQWPEKHLTKAPVWLSTDLRDGNQALLNPLDGEKKRAFFKMLCALGFKEMEVAFPSASQTDFNFVRGLIEEGLIPDDVTIGVITPAREHLIRRTFEAICGARRAIVHMYTAASPVFRDVVYGMSQNKVVDMVVKTVTLCKNLAAAMPETEVVFEYSVEAFTETEPDFALKISEAVIAAWDASPSRKMILNLPASVEVFTPNVYADRIEWMNRHLPRRESLILSLHPHNDRGTAVAAAELGLLAGADRVEGCLLGNGERCGNVDLITLALNLYTQGIDPGLDFSDMKSVTQTFEAYTGIPVHPRHPYAGDLVFTAFSGSHQDAIKKSMAARKAKDGGLWDIPYLTIDPADLGRGYDDIIRINSQSGKGGIAWMMETAHGIILPRAVQGEFSGIVQEYTDRFGGEIDAFKLWRLFSENYLETEGVVYRSHLLKDENSLELEVALYGQATRLQGTGETLLLAAQSALQGAGIDVLIENMEEGGFHAKNASENLPCVFVEIAGGIIGAGIDADFPAATLKALCNAVNRRQTIPQKTAG